MTDHALVPQGIPGRALALRHGVQKDLGSRMLWISDSALRNKLHLMAEAGAGKSRLLGRVLAWLLFLRHIPQIVLDPTGGTIDNLCLSTEK